MKPAIYNPEIEQGSTFERVFSITNATLVLTDYDLVRMKIRCVPGDTVAWDSTSTTPGGSITITDVSTIQLTLDAATTAAFSFDEANFDIELVVEGTPERVDKLIKGKIILNKESTR